MAVQRLEAMLIMQTCIGRQHYGPSRQNKPALYGG